MQRIISLAATVAATPSSAHVGDLSKMKWTEIGAFFADFALLGLALLAGAAFVTVRGWKQRRSAAIKVTETGAHTHDPR